MPSGLGLLRRSRDRRSLEKDAKVLRYVAGHGFPAPKVEELSVDGSALVMERIEAVDSDSAPVRSRSIVAPAMAHAALNGTAYAATRFRRAGVR